MTDNTKFSYPENNESIQKVKDIINNIAIINKYPSLKKYLNQTNQKIPQKHINQLITQIDFFFKDTILRYCLLQHLIMGQASSWHEISFFKDTFSDFLTAKLDLDNQLMNEPDLNSIIEKLKDKYEIKNPIVNENILNQLGNFSLLVFDTKYYIEHYSSINRLLTFLGSSLRLFSCVRPNENAYFLDIVLGECTEKFIDNCHVSIFNKEYIRSPNVFVSKVALSGDANIAVRRTALESIFHQKWLRAGQNPFGIENFPVLYQISEKIKLHIMSLLGVSNESDWLKIKDSFVDDLVEYILYHEIGHDIIKCDILPIESGSIVQATSQYRENFFSHLFEVLADLAPITTTRKGPVALFTQIAKKDQKRAEALFWAYFSDAFFYDTDLTHMYLYSDLFAVFLLKFVNKDKSINFQSLEQCLQPNSQFFKNIRSLVERNAMVISKLVKTSQYNTSSGPFIFEQIKKIVYADFREKKVSIDEQSSQFLTKLWKAYYRVTFSLGDKGDAIKKYIDESDTIELEQFFSIVAGDAAQKYQPRDYIIQRFIDCGFIPKNAYSVPIKATLTDNSQKRQREILKKRFQKKPTA